MTEQQKKLQQLVTRRTETLEEASKLQEESNRLQGEVHKKRELLIRLDGAIEAFSMLDIVLPEGDEES